jgi:integrase
MVNFKYSQFDTIIQVDSLEVAIGRIAARELKQNNFDLSKWYKTIEMIQNKEKRLIEIQEAVFCNTKSESQILAICKLLIHYNKDMMIDYLSYHAYICFTSHTWIHTLSYATYHGFSDDKNATFNSVLRSPSKKNSHKEITSIFQMVVNNSVDNPDIDLKIYPDFTNRQYLNLFYNNKWNQVTLDIKESHKIQKDILATKKLILDIENCLDNNISLKSILEYTNINEGVVVSYAFGIFEDKLLKIIKQNLRTQLHQNVQISLPVALEFHIKQVNHRLKRMKRDMPKTYEKLQKLTNFFQQKQLKHSKIYNKMILIKNDILIYPIGFIKRETWYSLIFDFENINNDPIAREIKSYIHYISQKKSRIDIIHHVISCVKYIKNKYKIYSLNAKKIKPEYVVDWLNTHDISDSTKKGYKNYISAFITFLISVESVKFKTLFKLPLSPSKNEIKDIQVKSKNTEFTEPLPEDVYLQIRAHINELSTYAKNAFLVISSTGCRPIELSSITPSSLYYDDRYDSYFLKIKISKQHKAYAKKGKHPYRVVPIYDEEVVAAFNEQVNISREPRDLFSSDCIFIRQSNAKKFQDKHYITSSKDLIREVNGLIKRHNIYSDLEDTLWRYSPYQMRAMIATIMVEKGHASDEIKSFFGWMSKHTSERAYAFVRKKKMMELNNNFFKEHFNVSFSDEALKQYSKKEKEDLFVDLYIHYRIMEYGKCVRHPIMGECGKLQNAQSCATCARLITSPEYLPYWEKMYDNQKEIFEAVVNKLESEGVDKEIYTTWGEYLIEEHRLKSYENLISKLKSKGEL